MGAFDEANDTITIHSPKWDAHETVTCRYIPTAEDEAWVHNQLIKHIADQNNKGMRNPKVTIENHTGETKLLWVARMIVSWTFTKGGMAMPVSLASVRKMKLDYTDYIYDEIMKHQEPFEMTPEEEQDFTNAATEPTVESLVAASAEEDSEEQPKQNRNYLSRLK